MYWGIARRTLSGMDLSMPAVLLDQETGEPNEGRPLRMSEAGETAGGDILPTSSKPPAAGGHPLTLGASSAPGPRPADMVPPQAPVRAPMPLPLGGASASPPPRSVQLGSPLASPRGSPLASAPHAPSQTLGAHTAKLTALKSWRAGTYRFHVSATDAAGNVATAASNRLVVK